MTRKFKLIVLIVGALLCLFMILTLLSRAPGYLLYSENPKKADCIIPLLGKEYVERKKEAFRLIAEGYSSVLLIPPRYRLVHVTNDSLKVPLQIKDELSDLSIYAYKGNPQYRWHENTHLELILAKEYMMAYKFDSAIIVSSPYHMRRVRIIADRVFGDGNYLITCVPDRFEAIHNPWWLDRKGLIWVSMEYLKIGWLLVYERFYDLISSVMDFFERIYTSR